MAPVQPQITMHKPKPQYSVLGVVPEKQLFAKEMLSGFSSHFWGQYMGSTQSIDGLVSTAPGEPSSLPLTTPSGLSRVQFLVASQALGIPCFPNYCKEQGGLVRGVEEGMVSMVQPPTLRMEFTPPSDALSGQVVDRVLVKAGGEDWWATLSGRVRAQNLLAAYQDNQLVSGEARQRAVPPSVSHSVNTQSHVVCRRGESSRTPPTTPSAPPAR